MSCSVVTDQRAWSPFCLQCVFNILPAPSTIISPCEREGAEGQRRQCVLETTTRRHTEEDFSGASDSQCEMDREGKKTILSLSLLGFLYYFIHSVDKVV